MCLIVVDTFKYRRYRVRKFSNRGRYVTMKNVCTSFALAILFAVSTGCATTDGAVAKDDVKLDVKSDVKKVAVKASVQFKSTGMPKYDQFLKGTTDLRGSITKASDSIGNLVPSFKAAIVSVVGGADQIGKDMSDFGALFGMFKKTLLEKQVTLSIVVNGPNVELAVTAGEGAPPELVTKVTEAIRGVNAALQNLRAIPESLQKVVTDSMSLVSQGQGLVTSAPSDFLGMNALKLPGCVTSLKDAIVNLTKVPDDVKGLIESLGKVISDLKDLKS